MNGDPNLIILFQDKPTNLHNKVIRFRFD